ncbi:MAG: hypothetical protein J7J98_03020 [candidate division Zixibacteria bacterium]|nr:hypothetical protein [candidate division Zixibacteria bacterium]
MTKKIIVTYAALFLFVFTFAFAFALEARADDPPCCPYEWCNNGQSVGIQGHWVLGNCVYDGISNCDTIFICADPN